MNVFLKMVSVELGAKVHAILIMDGAGWHKSRTLKVPENITALILLPYSPELNPVERLWAYLRSHYLSNRVYEDYQHLLDAGAQAWDMTPPLPKWPRCLDMSTGRRPAA
ncbi:MAG: transposase [Phycisphaerales bacterium]|nr:transposase [Phycisphaerales bacterium]